MYFRDRHDAGRQLAALLTAYAGRKDVFVLALPRGGVPVGFEVARALNAPLDAFLVRKLGVPGHEELAMGALASSGVRVLNRDTIDQLGIPPSVIEHVTAIEQGEPPRPRFDRSSQRVSSLPCRRPHRRPPTSCAAKSTRSSASSPHSRFTRLAC